MQETTEDTGQQNQQATEDVSQPSGDPTSGKAEETGKPEASGEGGSTSEGNQEPQETQEQSDWRDKEITKLRKESASKRNENKQISQQFEDLKKGIGQALGLESSDEPDPDKLQSELQQAQAASRKDRTQLEFYKSALKHGADADLTWAHLYTSGAFDNLDPKDEGFSEAVESSLQEALEQHPKLKADYAPETKKDVGGGSAPEADGQEVLPGKNPWNEEHRNLTEQARIMRENPDLARRLRNAAAA